MTSFFDQRLAESARKAEERAAAAENELSSALAQVDFLKKRLKEKPAKFFAAARVAYLEALQALHGKPPKFNLHLTPELKTAPIPPERFSLLELE